MTALTLLYVFLLFGRGVVLLQEPDPTVKIFGLAILVLPVFALWSIFSEIRFGLQSEALAKRLDAQDVSGLNLEYRPSGRATKDSAQREFLRVSGALKDNESWELWFQLGQSYEANGDRRRARSAIRKAITLSNQANSSKS